MENDQRIFTVRGVAVMLDSDLAGVYGVETGAMNRAVERNPERFAEPFSFRLTTEEWENLICQIGISSSWGGRRKLPRVFTEHGAVMLAAVLSSDRAIAASRAVVDAFVRIRRALDLNRTLAKKLDELAARSYKHERDIAIIFHELRQMTEPEPEEPEKPRRRIGFKTKEQREREDREHGRKRRQRQETTERL